MGSSLNLSRVYITKVAASQRRSLSYCSYEEQTSCTAEWTSIWCFHHASHWKQDEAFCKEFCSTMSTFFFKIQALHKGKEKHKLLVWGHISKETETQYVSFALLFCLHGIWNWNTPTHQISAFSSTDVNTLARHTPQATETKQDLHVSIMTS